MQSASVNTRMRPRDSRAPRFLAAGVPGFVSDSTLSQGRDWESLRASDSVESVELLSTTMASHGSEVFWRASESMQASSLSDSFRAAMITETNGTGLV